MSHRRTWRLILCAWLVSVNAAFLTAADPVDIYRDWVSSCIDESIPFNKDRSYGAWTPTEQQKQQALVYCKDIASKYKRKAFAEIAEGEISEEARMLKINHLIIMGFFSAEIKSIASGGLSADSVKRVQNELRDLGIDPLKEQIVSWYLIGSLPGCDVMINVSLADDLRDKYNETRFMPIEGNNDIIFKAWSDSSFGTYISLYDTLGNKILDVNFLKSGLKARF